MDAFGYTTLSRPQTSPAKAELDRLPSRSRGIPSPLPKLGASAAATSSQGRLVSSLVNVSSTPWTDEERCWYLRSLRLADLPGEESLLSVLDAALADAPMPSPWQMTRDARQRVFFVNTTTGKSSWQHPMEPALRELASMCRPYKFARELEKWRSAPDQDGREYYFNTETDESSWEHPSVTLLPVLYLKVRALERLCEMDDPTEMPLFLEVDAESLASDLRQLSSRREAWSAMPPSTPPPLMREPKSPAGCARRGRAALGKRRPGTAGCSGRNVNRWEIGFAGS